ncbi:MAG: phosphoribosyltransferase family protein, partial [Proteobacteria bacterium]|nr:phosphoribosyltransferase family protein [Pseudomonadota bacterium]
LHWTRSFTRRFNQSALLAKVVARHGDIEFLPEVLTRHRRTPSQGRLNAGARQRNVQGAFRVPERYRDTVKGKRVLLVDDVLTTGATVSACAGVLRRAGAVGVDVLTVARVVRETQ